MARKTKNYDVKGSQKDIQVLVNKNQDLIDKRIKSAFKDLAKEQIIWTSPIENDEFAEYSDEDFLKKVELAPDQIKLTKFWPLGGPNWDALAKTTNGHVILVEAKANIPEIVSQGTGAEGDSKKLILKSLNETKAYLNITENEVDWSGKYYQYTNRLAHLYFLREKCEIPAFLVNIYFIGDKTVSGPNTIEEWEDAIEKLHKELKLPHKHKLSEYTHKHKLSEYMTDIFIDVKELKQ